MKFPGRDDEVYGNLVVVQTLAAGDRAWISTPGLDTARSVQLSRLNPVSKQSSADFGE